MWQLLRDLTNQLVIRKPKRHDLNIIHVEPLRSNGKRKQYVQPETTEKFMQSHLKIKLKSLAEEAKIIRLEERKRKKHYRKAVVVESKRMSAAIDDLIRTRFPGNPAEAAQVANIDKLRQDARGTASVAEATKWKTLAENELHSLHHHRVIDVRRESRASNLAYGFLRGRSYQEMEQKCYEFPPFDRVRTLAEKFSGEDVRIVRQRYAAWQDAAANYVTKQT